MRVSQLIHAMGKEDRIVIDDFDKKIDQMRIFDGIVRWIKKDSPLNKMHVLSICADNDTIFVLAREQRKKVGEE